MGIFRYRVAFWINLQQNRRRRMAVLIKTYMPSPAVTREIGKFVIAFGHLENVLRLTIKSLLKISIDDPLLEKEIGKKLIGQVLEKLES